MIQRNIDLFEKKTSLEDWVSSAGLLRLQRRGRSALFFLLPQDDTARFTAHSLPLTLASHPLPLTLNRSPLRLS